MEALDLQDIISAIPGIVYVKDKNGIFLFSNGRPDLEGSSSFQAVEGKKMVGKTDFDFPWKNQAEEFQENDRKVMETEQKFSFVEKASFSEGKEAYFYSVKAPLYNKKGELIGIIGNSLNITGLIQGA